MNIYGITIDKLEEYFDSIGSKRFHAKQLYRWLYDKKINSFDEITDMKKDEIELIKKDFDMSLIKMVKVEKDEDTRKYLFELNDKEHIEAVLMLHDYGKSVCISSEVGCNMGCKFCESGRRKKVRELDTYEMVEQILLIEEELGEKITHVVIMGIGEPFDNYDNVIDFIKIINNNYGLSIGARHITVSTCGIIPKIEEFSNLELQVNLAISLHAPNNEIRNKIMPINKVYPIDKLIPSNIIYSIVTLLPVLSKYFFKQGINFSIG